MRLRISEISVLRPAVLLAAVSVLIMSVAKYPTHQSSTLKSRYDRLSKELNLYTILTCLHHLASVTARNNE